MNIKPDDPRIPFLIGDKRSWWDVSEQRFVPSATVYVAFGCPDWGESDRGGKLERNNLCTFCPLPNAVAAYRDAFYGGKPVPPRDHIGLFRVTLQNAVPPDGDAHTLMVFNGGSFLAMEDVVQEAIAREVIGHGKIKRLVVESRAELVTEAAVGRITNLLAPAGKKLTIRMGVETQDDDFRLGILRKGCPRRQLREVVEIAKRHAVTCGGYSLLNPAPSLDPQWAMEEAVRTVEWILGSEMDDLGMDEVYFCSTNVGIGTPLTEAWRGGDFQPASLWMVLKVLERVAADYPGRVHLLPFRDEPELLAVPSNHTRRGIPQNLSGASGCDLGFHAMLEQYRQTMDHQKLVPPQCECRPDWL